MKEENRKVIFDRDLQLEACFSMVSPSHFLRISTNIM